MITLVELGKSTTMPPVKPQRMALAVIISICCAFSGYLLRFSARETVRLFPAILARVIVSITRHRHPNNPLP